ncbi:transketolase family protein [Streptococcus pluranimalium]|uniref:transketolase family protein n=1 Tax=Streptococcus pluranimalium TaxID=82348 RepID=UPI004046E427
MNRQTKEMRLVYRDFLKETNLERQDLAVLEADLSSSMMTHTLAQDFGDRYINVGIMEAEMIGAAAGLSLRGYKPYIHTFGPFASRRVFDQVFVSLAYAQLDATLIGSDAGVTAEVNGGTHMPFEDLSLMRAIPKAHVFEASDDVSFQAILENTLQLPGFKYIRTTRKAPKPLYDDKQDFSKGYCQLREGDDMTIVASGIMVAEALEACQLLEKEGLSVGLIDLFQIKPLPDNLESLLAGKPVLTVENHNKIGGLGSAICELLSQRTDTPVKRMGVDEAFGQVGKTDYLLEAYGLSVGHIVDAARAYIEKYK